MARGDLFKQYAGKTDTVTVGMAYYADIVRRPGKFEGEAPYVPYFWDKYLEGWHDVDHIHESESELVRTGPTVVKDAGGVLRFTVTARDKEIFPELKRRKVVKLYEREDGFVVEVR